MMRASLPMYDLATVTQATDDWWRGLARHFRAAGFSRVPDELTRSHHLLDDWQATDLLISQTCGYPLTHALANRVQIVATPCYRAPGCAGAWYSSAVLVRANEPAESLADLVGRTAVINGSDSQSGCHALRHLVAREAGGSPFFGRVRISGSHLASIKAVANGTADVAAVDTVTHELLVRHAPATLSNTRILEYSQRAPGLPYITSHDMPHEHLRNLRAGLTAAMADPILRAARQTLLIEGFEILSDDDYEPVLAMENEVDIAGLPVWE